VLKKVQVGVSLLAMGLMTLAQAAPKVEFEGLERVTPETALSYISVPTTDKVSKGASERHD
jgi:Outer membrane protein/protective antigen OMA87